MFLAYSWKCIFLNLRKIKTLISVNLHVNNFVTSKVSTIQKFCTSKQFCINIICAGTYKLSLWHFLICFCNGLHLQFCMKHLIIIYMMWKITVTGTYKCNEWESTTRWKRLSSQYIITQNIYTIICAIAIRTSSKLIIFIRNPKYPA